MNVLNQMVWDQSLGDNAAQDSALVAEEGQTQAVNA